MAKVKVEVKKRDVHADLVELLKKRLPGVFDREPAPAYNSKLDLLVDDILSF